MRGDPYGAKEQDNAEKDLGDDSAGALDAATEWK